MDVEKIIQLDDLISSYGSGFEPHFQRKISGLEEFTSLASEVKETPPKKGEYYKHQRFTHRYLEHYDNLLVLSETGTGKTCEIVGFLEMTRDYFNKRDVSIEKEGVAHFKQVYIFVKNDTQKKELRKQIVCNCSDGRYINDELLRATTEPTQKGAITRILEKAGYFIKTYASASNMISELLINPVTKKVVHSLQDEHVKKQLHEMFDDSIIWIDEAHNLISEVIGETEAPKQKSGKGNPSKHEIYENMNYILHLARRCKRILSTATPMINETRELGPLLNLILPVNGVLPEDYNYKIINKYEQDIFFPGLVSVSNEEFRNLSEAEVSPYFQGQFPPEFDFENTSLRKLEPYLRGRINFVRAADTGANPTPQGFNLDYTHQHHDANFRSQVIVFPSIMSQFQFNSYVKASRGENGRGESGWRSGERQAANMVFPDGTWGEGSRQRLTDEFNPDRPNIGGRQEVRIGGYHKYFDNGAPTPQFVQEIGDLRTKNRQEIIENIRRLSAKYGTICELIQGEGICFIFDEKVNGSGLLALAGCLRCLGFQYYDGKTSIFVGSDESMKPYCSSVDRSSKRMIRSDFNPSLRFSILWQDTVKDSDKILEAVNCYENRHGDYVKILLCSRVGREGINVKNVRQIHIVSSGWNQSNNLQAIARGIRATSHVDLVEEKRQAATTEEERNNVKIDVLIFNHVALPPYADINKIIDDQIISPNDYSFDRNDETDEEEENLTNIVIDVSLFLTSEDKDISIKRVMRKLKQASISCNIHRVRNQRLISENKSSDVDYTSTCDYQTCVYSCFDDPPLEIDSSNFDLLYSGEIVKEVEKEIFDYLKETNKFSFEALLERTERFYKPIYLAMALEKIVLNKKEIYDRFGYVNFLREDNGFFYLERSYPSKKSNRLMSYYTDGLIAVEPSALSTLVRNIDIEEGNVLIEELQLLNPFSPEFSQLLHEASIIALEVVLENAISRRVFKKESNDYINRIIDHFFASVVYVFHRPELSIKSVALEQTRSKRGRKRVNEAPVTSIMFKEGMDIIEQTDTPLVYIHNLEGQNEKLTKYGAMSNFNKGNGILRILESDSERGWRNVKTVAEQSIYNYLLQKNQMVRRRAYEEKRIYGIVDFQGVFRIRDTEKDKLETKDTRNTATGNECITWETKDFFQLLWTLHYQPPNMTNVKWPNVEYEYQNVPAFRKLFASYDEFIYDPSRSIAFYIWYKSGKAKTVQCEELKEIFRHDGRLLILFPEN